MAGRVKEEYPNDVEVETVYSGFLGLGHKGDAIKPPNLAVDEKVLGAEPTFEEIEKAVKERLALRKS